MGWVEVIHKCKTPNLMEVEEAEVQVGTTWQCEGKRPGTDDTCGDIWKLRQIKNEQGMRGAVGHFPKWDRLTVNGTEVPSDGK